MELVHQQLHSDEVGTMKRHREIILNKEEELPWEHKVVHAFQERVKDIVVTFSAFEVCKNCGYITSLYPLFAPLYPLFTLLHGLFGNWWCL